MTKLTHFNTEGDAHIVDIGDKAETRRVAVAAGRILMQAATLQAVIQGEHKKGDVLGIARIAGIMASKRTDELIPLCHAVPLTHIDIEFDCIEAERAIECRVQAETVGRTGVEIEALMAVQMALLTIYDMCKAVDRGMQIEAVRLLHKSGGKSGEFNSNDYHGDTESTESTEKI